jgi:electron transport complex protein RnfC
MQAGDPLLDHPAEGSHMAIVPVDAAVEDVANVSLLDGREVPAARLRVIRTELPASTPPVVLAYATPSARSEDVLKGVEAKDLGLWIDRLRDGGVWVDRWTSPDLLGQLNAALRRPIDSVICNLLDVDPTVPLNAALAANYPQELLAGLALLSRVTEATRTWATIDMRTPLSWWTKLRPPGKGELRPALVVPGFKLIPLVNDYPQADPSLLLYALLNRRLRPGRLPAELGVLVLDAAAAIAVGRLVLHDAPMLTVPLAIRDHERRESHFCTVPVGTLLGHVLRRLGLRPAAQLVLRGGDVLRDICISGDAVIGGTELQVHASPHEPPINPDPCIRCGWCFESCPTRVQPANCLEAAQRDDAGLAIKFGISGCIDCGICSYVCPSHLPILAGIRQMRGRMDAL